MIKKGLQLMENCSVWNGVPEKYAHVNWIKMHRLAFILLILVPSISWACSFAQMMEDFEVTPGEGATPQKPEFTVQSIKRGFNDGNYSSCSDAGFITLKMGSAENAKIGYEFTIVEGSFEDQLFSSKPVIATPRFAERGEYNFIWLDGNTDEQEAFDITVKITAVSNTGQKSEPQFLQISDPGVEKAWWQFW